MDCRTQEQLVNIKILIYRQPPTESIPYIPLQKYLTVGASPGEKVGVLLYDALNQSNDSYYCTSTLKHIFGLSVTHIFISFHQHKAAFTMRVLHNPDHPKHRDLMRQNYGLHLPDLHKKPGPTVSFISIIFSFS